MSYSFLFPFLPLKKNASGAEYNLVVCPSRASKCAGSVILRVTVNIRAPILEKLGETCRSAVAWIATVLVGLEHGARPVTSSRNLQFIRALAKNVSSALDHAVAWGRDRAKFHGNIESVNVGHVNEIHVIELLQRVLGQGVRCCTVALALEESVTVTGLAFAFAGSIKLAFGSSPNAGCFCAWLGGDGPCLTLVELPAASGHSGGPDGVGAIVCDIEFGSMSQGDGNDNKKSRRNGKSFNELHFGEDNEYENR